MTARGAAVNRAEATGRPLSERLALVAVAGLLVGGLLASQAAAGIDNVRLERAPANASPRDAVAGSVASGDTAWIGYRFRDRFDRHLCCGHGWPGREACRLSDDEASSFTWGERRGDGPRTGPEGVVALLRVSEGTVTRLMTVSESCRVDGDGERLVWLDGVDVDASLDLVAPLAERSRERWSPEGSASSRVAHAAVAAVALHEGARADATLASWALEGDPSGELAEQAVFWLGEARGEQGARALERVLDAPGREELGADAVFALSLDESARARRLLGELAAGGRRPDLQGEALFWLAQGGEPGIERTLAAAAEGASSGDVRERAVFAMSQLPEPRAVDALVVALRTTSHPDVRRQALFWLATSDDPRALDAIERLLAD